MSDFKVNNVRVTHRGREISIAKHYRGDEVVVQEVAIIPADYGADTFDDPWVIKTFDGTLDSLLVTLLSLRQQIERT
jgi:hypothetical protein